MDAKEIAKEVAAVLASAPSKVELWDSVCKTDPAHTKQFSRSGGFKGTAIKPYWLVRRATENFGPAGIGWGWTEIENKYIAGTWCSKVRLWYLLNGQRGELEQWGQTIMEGTNKNGAFVDEEAPKKAVTDAVTKCLSYLGFAGDVHMGLFDDSKYIQELNVEFRHTKQETPESRKKKAGDIKKAIAESGDPAATWHQHLNDINEIEKADKVLYQELIQAGAKRKDELAKQAKSKPSDVLGGDTIPY